MLIFWDFFEHMEDLFKYDTAILFSFQNLQDIHFLVHP